MIAYKRYVTDPRGRREAEALTSRGDSVDFICLREVGEKPFEIINGVNVYRLPQGHYRGDNKIAYLISYLIFFVHSFMRLTRLFLQKYYDVIHINTMPDFIVFVALIPKIWGKKIILDIYDTVPELYMSKFKLARSHGFVRLLRSVEVISAEFADIVIAVHHPHRELLIEHGIPKDKIRVLLNLSDENIFYPVRRNDPARKDEFNIVFHGTITERIALDTVLEAVKMLRDRISNLKLFIYGEGDYLADIIELSQRLGLDAIVFFSKKFVPIDRMPTLLMKSDLAVVPHKNDSATKYMLPTKLLEYVALGIPCVVAKSQTISCYFDDSAVRFYEPENAADLANVIWDLYRHPEKRGELVKNADKFNKVYNWKSHKQVYYDIIDSLC